MGGPGSGKGMRLNRARSKLFTNQLACLDSFRLFSLIKTNPEQSMFDWNGIRLTRQDEGIALTSLDAAAPLMWAFLRVASTSCNYGGARYWLICPHCKRNVRLIYRQRGEFGCRRCFNLAYQSQNEILADRLLRKRNRIWTRLKGGPSSDGEIRPKWMHGATHENLLDEVSRLEDLAMAAFITRARRLSSIEHLDHLSILALECSVLHRYKPE